MPKNKTTAFDRTTVLSDFARTQRLGRASLPGTYDRTAFVASLLGEVDSIGWPDDALLSFMALVIKHACPDALQRMAFAIENERETLTYIVEYGCAPGDPSACEQQEWFARAVA
ncbi:MAG: hypothetical protein WKG01_07765 [Kofleriaceae bacterium]